MVRIDRRPVSACHSLHPDAIEIRAVISGRDVRITGGIGLAQDAGLDGGERWLRPKCGTALEEITDTTHTLPRYDLSVDC